MATQTLHNGGDKKALGGKARGISQADQKNRKSHGLAIFLGGERTFYFDNQKFKVTGNTIVYFPKGSNYTIKEKTPYDCYAINFEMPDGVIFEPFSFKIKNSNSYIESFKQARRHQAHKNPGYDAKIKSELYNIIYNMQIGRAHV